MKFKLFLTLILACLFVGVFSAADAQTFSENAILALDWEPTTTAQHYAVGLPNGVIKIVDAATDKVLRVLEHPDDSTRVQVLEYSPDGTKIAAAQSGGMVYIWDLNSQHISPIHNFQTHGPEYVVSLAWNSDGTQLAGAAPEGGWLYVWDMSGLTFEKEFGGYNVLLSVDWYEDGLLLSTLNVTRVFSATNGEIVREVGLNPTEIMRALWNPAHDRVVSGSLLGPVRVWADDGGLITDPPELEMNHPLLLNLAWHPSGDWIATVGLDGKINIWDAWDASLVKTITPSGLPLIAKWSPDGELFAYTVDDDGQSSVIIDTIELPVED